MHSNSRLYLQNRFTACWNDEKWKEIVLEKVNHSASIIASINLCSSTPSNPYHLFLQNGGQGKELFIMNMSINEAGRI